MLLHHRDAIGLRRGEGLVRRGVGRQVGGEGVEVGGADVLVPAVLEGGEAVAAAGQELVHGDPVGLARVEGLAVQLHRVLDDAVGAGLGHVQGVRQALGDLEDLRGGLVRAADLLLEAGEQLRAGEVDDVHHVGEGLDGERLAVGDHAVALRAGRLEGQVGADAAGVHQGELGAALVVRRGGLQLGVGDEVAERRLGGVGAAARDVGGDMADGAAGDRCGELVPARDQRGHVRGLGLGAVDDVVGRAGHLDGGPHDVLGAAVVGQRGVGVELAVGRGGGDGARRCPTGPGRCRRTPGGCGR